MASKTQHIRINEQIRVPEVRVVGPEGENFGVLTLKDAVAKAKELGFDLIEISPQAVPPVCKIMDYGRYIYDLKKKQKVIKAKANVVEVKNIQVKVGTSENDLQLKARKASEWLAEGHRIKLDLFLPGRTKYMEKGFLESRMDRLLKFITVAHKIADAPKKSPKGLTAIIEKA